MKKSMIPFLTAVSLAAVAMPFQTSAIFQTINGSSSAKEFFEERGCISIDEYNIFFREKEGYEYFLSDRGSTVYRARRMNDYASFVIEYADPETVRAELSERLGESVPVEVREDTDRDGKTTLICHAINAVDENGNTRSLTDYEVKECCAVLEKYGLLEVKYYKDRYSYEEISYHYFTAYDTYLDNKEDIIEKLSDYVSSHDIGAEVKIYAAGETDPTGWTLEEKDIYKDYVFLVPDKELSNLEHLQLANDIYLECGLIPYGIIPDIFRTINAEIDVLGAVDGDANDDSALDISDAVTIMQAISNPDKYSLTAQGKFNADITGNGDGITMGDALEIQQRLLNSAE